ncbi:undecaprenyldiphospho-muramoylpentapeptide beta-N-acetylglucosaminyltransferase [Geomonas sp. Red69]|uniref:UDP-N-acetylglucosamine--N-acetylmuramyl-(pentapeptide) pyrophosphoryl-undecaprenol N-acetylglucosamine transferase n=1 Tax=Geomonas diazotrophica TaxID=2843197 RepID=A0ABX8JI10_9BACT|nr:MULTISPECIES: undecaprenyldiphospho-muramoylpentapeptide beta-N-acetylglucosaminyltransferase [Geomonas]MBU5637393.1 undecaprenyldiphospho-muramoylpentapeptide beta-N-acetylglucosaminyltransferase [Geomonas diazotrophica]QWV97938.1 undecaprenyldiphospho-muramoylpentapeptide beta-N-acetylglucosaminyltransferase [Geomonas nitrogeniifigens]QXE87078.1 undecaprenyldiphospho-muramoylpentapeptide beta-N-acetylglucosaminyltransferase [Geomonas nitrogeniifigens]
MRLIIAGGGTGGHLFPGIAVADEFLGRGSENEVLFVGTERGIEARLLPKLGYRLELISASGMKGMGSVKKLLSAGRLLYGYSQSRKILKSFKPDMVLGVGGYASAPMLLAARGMGVRTFIHEQNAAPGLTNKVLSRVVDGIFISMEEAAGFFPGKVTQMTGNPIRKEILWGFQEQRARLTGDTFNLLVFGGSAGAQRINSALLEALPHLEQVKHKLRITHQTGEKDVARVREGYQAQGVQAQVLSFIDNMSAAYGAADLVICRAGATTIAEVTACGKGCIFIPYPFAADDHQRKNAESLVKRDAGRMILEEDLTGEHLAAEILNLMEHPEQVAELEKNARSLAQLDAAQAIVAAMVLKTD